MVNVYKTFIDEQGMVIEVLDKEIDKVVPPCATERYSNVESTHQEKIEFSDEVAVRKAKRQLDVERIINLGEKGYSVRQIEALTGLNRNKVQRALQKHKGESE